jgi:hypothetical protein
MRVLIMLEKTEMGSAVPVPDLAIVIEGQSPAEADAAS